MPAHYLPLALWLEADRMASLKVEQSAFTRERTWSRKSAGMRVDNPPYGRLAEMVYDATFTTHPYKHQVIGSMADLEAARIEDVRDFFETYYVPENAVLVIAGDFDPVATGELVQRYFGRVPKAKKPVPRDIPQEPTQTTERRLTVYEDVPLPAVVVAHHITFDGHPDSYPLHIVNKVLSDGNSSRIYRSLVYEKRLALAAFGGGNIVEDPNLFFAIAIVQPGQVDRGRREGAHRRARSADARSRSPSASCSAPRTSSRATTSSRLTDPGQGEHAGPRRRHPQRHGDRRRRVRHLPERTTAADVQRVARTYFTPANARRSSRSCRERPRRPRRPSR